MINNNSFIRSFDKSLSIFFNATEEEETKRVKTMLGLIERSIANSPQYDFLKNSLQSDTFDEFEDKISDFSEHDKMKFLSLIVEMQEKVRKAIDQDKQSQKKADQDKQTF